MNDNLTPGWTAEKFVESFSQLHGDLCGLLGPLARSTSDDPDAALHEAMICLWRHVGELGNTEWLEWPKEEQLRYMCRVLKNAAHRLRNEHARPAEKLAAALQQGNIDVTDAVPATPGLAFDLKHHVLPLIAQLPPRKRQAFELGVLGHLPPRELEKAMGIPAEDARRARRRAAATVREGAAGIEGVYAGSRLEVIDQHGKSWADVAAFGHRFRIDVNGVLRGHVQLRPGSGFDGSTQLAVMVVGRERPDGALSAPFAIGPFVDNAADVATPFLDGREASERRVPTDLLRLAFLGIAL